MATKKVGVCVGLMGGALYEAGYPQTPAHRYWVNYFRAVDHSGYDFMRLAFDGSTAGTPGGIELTPGGPDGHVLPNYYREGVNSLLDGAPDDTWQVEAAVYDWRKDMMSEATNLANYIKGQVEQGGVSEYRLAAHSQGGIIARLVWGILNAQGKASYVPRIVTVCSPHYGCWQVASSLLSYSTQVIELAQSLGFVRAQVNVDFTARRREIASTCVNWPAFYQLMPQLGGPSDDGTDNRAALYDPKSWPSWVGVNTKLLGAALPFQQTLNTPAYTPPPETMFIIYSSQVQTSFGNQAPSAGAKLAGIKLGDEKYAGSGDGDGTVLTPDQWIFGYDRFQVGGWVHADAFRLAGQSQLLPWAMFQWQYGSRTAPPAFQAGVVQPSIRESPWWNLPFLNARTKPKIGGSILSPATIHLDP